MNQVLLSIIIPVFNNWKFTKNCLSNLCLLDDKICEIIIADNNSTDETALEIKKFTETYKNIIHIKNKENYGFGKAINISYQHSHGSNILILNNDIKFGNSTKEILNEWLYSFIEQLQRFPNSLLGPTAGYIDPVSFNFKYETEDFSRPINYMSGWCLGASREAWSKLILDGESGPFDSKNFFLYFEDCDISKRAKDLNINFVQSRVPFKHIGKQTTSKMNVNKLYTESRQIFINKWKNK